MTINIYRCSSTPLDRRKHVTRKMSISGIKQHRANLFSKFVLQSVQSPESILKLGAVLPAYNATVLTTFKHNQSLDTFMVLQGGRELTVHVVLLLLGGFDQLEFSCQADDINNTTFPSLC